MEDKAFCEYCCQSNEYTIKEKDLFGKVNGRYIFYRGQEAHCNKCGNIIYPQKVLDHNSKIVKDKAGE